VSLHYGASHPDLLTFRELADRCAAKWPTFRVQYYAEAEAQGSIRPGRIDLGYACAALRAPHNADYYLCGPEAMVDVFRSRLIDDFHVPAAGVHVDEWQ
jgi:ferredoxin-NADP reductase